MENDKPTLEEFNRTWLCCRKAMDLIILQNGYEALTFPNITTLTGIPETTLKKMFFSEKLLIEMYDQLTVMNQFVERLINDDPLN